MSDLTQVLSQYAILHSIAEHLSALDLYHLALSSHSVYSTIFDPVQVFQQLKRVSVCDGTGLRRRQNYEFPCSKARSFCRFGRCEPACQDERFCLSSEEVEMRVFNVKCDEYDALPCVKCGINVCEECRWYPRIFEDWWHGSRWPHLDPACECHTIVCYCWKCEAQIAKDLAHGLYGDWCYCETYTRWICMECHGREVLYDKWYSKNRTRYHSDYAEDYSDGKVLTDNQSSRALWCPCGERSPIDGNIRCQWCKRQHTEASWSKPQSPNPVQDDPCNSIEYGAYGGEYAELRYSGPIWNASEQ